MELGTMELALRHDNNSLFAATVAAAEAAPINEDMASQSPTGELLNLILLSHQYTETSVQRPLL
jgi:hypothetical protein